METTIYIALDETADIGLEFCDMLTGNTKLASLSITFVLMILLFYVNFI